MLAVITAMQKEADALLVHASVEKEYTLCGKKIWSAEAFGTKFCLVLAGVGKSNAAAATMLSVSALKADKLLNFGVAGGISEKTQIAKIFRITRAVQYDFDLSEINGTPKGTLDEYDSPYIPLCEGKSAFPYASLATGDKLTNATTDVPLFQAFGADVRDMEGAAIAHVAHFTGTPLFAYKSISNKIGGVSVSQYRQNLARALSALSENMGIIFREIGTSN